MFKMKNLVSIVLCLMMVFSVIGVSAADSIAVVVDGNTITLEVQPVIVNGRALVPIRPVVEAIGGSILWDDATKTVAITTCDKEITLVIDSTKPMVNGVAQTIEVPAQIISGRTLVPLRFVGTALGAEVVYDDTAKTAKINYFTNMTGTLKVGGSTTIQPIAQAAADYLNGANTQKGLSIGVSGGGSGVGVKNCMNGQLNVGMSSSELSAQQLKDYPNIKESIIGKDGIVVILNPKNTVKNLTKQQVFDIFTGVTKNWSEVGGANAPILVQVREATSGTYTAFIDLALKPINPKAKFVGSATPYNSNGLLKDAVAKNDNAVGFLSMGYVDASISTPTVENITPTKVNALTKKWPYVRPLLILTNGKAQGLAAQFINFLVSPKGQEMMNKEGYLPLNVQD